MSLSMEHVNEQALGVASSVLNDSVVAAARCEQVTQDQQLEASESGAPPGSRDLQGRSRQRCDQCRFRRSR